MLRAGASINFDQANENPLNLAAFFLNCYIKTNRENETQKEIVRELICSGISPNDRDQSDLSPISYLTKKHCTDLILLIIKAGAKVSTRERQEIHRLYIKKNLGYTIDNPLTLQNSAAISIRNTIRANTNKDIRIATCALQIPKTIKSIINMNSF